MTLEKRHLIIPSDISGFEFQCLNESCGARIMVLSERGTHIPKICPQCNAMWFDSAKGESAGAYKALQVFMDSRRDLARLRENIGCSLRLELRLPEEH